MSIRSLLRMAVGAVSDLALPRACAACGQPATVLCSSCADDLRRACFPGGPRVVVPQPGPPGMPPTTAAGEYAGALATLLHAYKDEGRRDLADLLGDLLAASVCRAVGQDPVSGAVGEDVVSGHVLASGVRPILLVPVPSRPQARRRRGDAPLEHLAARARDVLTDRDVLLAPVLAVGRQVQDQAGLGAGERAANLAGAHRVTVRGRRLVPGCVCLLVDDVVTTGATLAEGARTLREAGAQHVAAATIAATRRRSGGRRPVL